MPDFLMHDERDDVGVAVVDIKAGQVVRGQSLHGKAVREVKTLVDIPLGHKLALRDFKSREALTPPQRQASQAPKTPAFHLKSLRLSNIACHRRHAYTPDAFRTTSR